MKKALILGIDPGLTGGIAAVCGSTGRLEFVAPMPTAEGKPSIIGGKDHNIDVTEFYRILQPLIEVSVLAVVEHVHSMPKQGVASTFKFGFQYGAICGVLEGLKFSRGNSFRIQKAVPAVWKSSLNLSSNKKDSLILASKTWPTHAALFKLKKNDGLAEAALLAEFGRKTFALPKDCAGLDEILS